MKNKIDDYKLSAGYLVNLIENGDFKELAVLIKKVKNAEVISAVAKEFSKYIKNGWGEYL